jgi:hypothetical protein
MGGAGAGQGGKKRGLDDLGLIGRDGPSAEGLKQRRRQNQSRRGSSGNRYGESDEDSDVDEPGAEAHRRRSGSAGGSSGGSGGRNVRKKGANGARAAPAGVGGRRKAKAPGEPEIIEIQDTDEEEEDDDDGGGKAAASSEEDGERAGYRASQMSSQRGKVWVYVFVHG